MDGRRYSSSYDYYYPPTGQQQQQHGQFEAPQPLSAPDTYEYHHTDQPVVRGAYENHRSSSPAPAPAAVIANHGYGYGSNAGYGYSNVPPPVNTNLLYSTSTNNGGNATDGHYLSASDGGGGGDFTASSSTKTGYANGFANGYGDKRNTMSHHNPYSDAGIYAAAYNAAGPDAAKEFYNNGHPESGVTVGDGKDEGSDKNFLNGEGGKARRRARRKCCGNGMYCWCCSRKCCCIFLPILAVILVALGITLFFVFPRIPDINFTGISVSKSDFSAAATADSEAPSANDFSKLAENLNINRAGIVTVPLMIHLNVTNPNYIPWTIHNVTVDGWLKNTTQGGSDFPVGSGYLTEPFKMPKRSNSNDMAITFFFRLDISNNNYLQAAEIVQGACTAGGPDLRFHYNAKVILRAISWLGIKPVISDTISFACPFDDLSGMGISLSNLTGII
ncbi:hypothetical protein GGF40_003689 [Coemansia sp. RSA 1286]|nr:hypothetical protein GGF40_003689 [Coemansia sp. RSA 1286]